MITIYKHYINKTGISKAFEETKFEGAIASEEPDTVISLTDYNKLREILGVVTTKEMTDQKFYDDLCNFIIKEEKAITDEINGEEEEYTMEISLGMLILVYGIYFIATDVQFNRNINEAIR